MPVALIGVSYSVVIFPRLNEAFLNKNGELFYQELFTGIRTIALWMAPTIALFIVLRAHIVRVALGAGKFSWEDTRLTAASLAVLAIAMIAGSLAPLLIKAFYAIEKTWAPLFINMFSAVFSIASAVVFSRLLQGHSLFASIVFNTFRVADLASADMLSLAMGFALGLLIDNVLLYIALRRTCRSTFNTHVVFPTWSLAHMAIAAILAGFGAYAVRLMFTQALPLITLFAVLIQGFVAGVAGLGLYFAILVVLKNEDIAGVQKTFTRRLITLRVLPKSWDTDSMI